MIERIIKNIYFVNELPKDLIGYSVLAKENNGYIIKLDKTLNKNLIFEEYSCASERKRIRTVKHVLLDDIEDIKHKLRVRYKKVFQRFEGIIDSAIDTARRQGVIYLRDKPRDISHVRVKLERKRAMDPAYVLQVDSYEWSIKLISDTYKCLVVKK